MNKIIVYLRAGGTEVFYNASYRECLGNLIISWYGRAGGNKHTKTFRPDEYFSYDLIS